MNTRLDILCELWPEGAFVAVADYVADDDERQPLIPLPKYFQEQNLSPTQPPTERVTFDVPVTSTRQFRQLQAHAEALEACLRDVRDWLQAGLKSDDWAPLGLVRRLFNRVEAALTSQEVIPQSSTELKLEEAEKALALLRRQVFEATKAIDREIEILRKGDFTDEHSRQRRIAYLENTRLAGNPNWRRGRKAASAPGGSRSPYSAPVAARHAPAQPSGTGMPYRTNAQRGTQSHRVRCTVASLYAQINRGVCLLPGAMPRAGVHIPCPELAAAPLFFGLLRPIFGTACRHSPK